MKIKYGMVILCVFALIISSSGMYAWQTQEAKVEEKNRPIPTSTDGNFNAELGIRGNERPILELQGTYHYRGRIIFIQGNEDKRFSGAFIGNVFFIRTQLRGGIHTIFGKCRYGEDNSFTGVWIIRGLQNRGWIEGLFD